MASKVCITTQQPAFPSQCVVCCGEGKVKEKLSLSKTIREFNQVSRQVSTTIGPIWYCDAHHVEHTARRRADDRIGVYSMYASVAIVGLYAVSKRFDLMREANLFGDVVLTVAAVVAVWIGIWVIARAATFFFMGRRSGARVGTLRQEGLLGVSGSMVIQNGLIEGLELNFDSAEFAKAFSNLNRRKLAK